jgi:hypothetical protein
MLKSFKRTSLLRTQAQKVLLNWSTRRGKKRQKEGVSTKEKNGEISLNFFVQDFLTDFDFTTPWLVPRHSA